MLRPFATLTALQEAVLFHEPPGWLSASSSAAELAAALGATLYTPATHADLAGSIRRAVGRGVTSLVMCLEDAIPDEAVPAATVTVAQTVMDLAGAELGEIPQLFVRVRSAEHLLELVEKTDGELDALQGFVAPKFSVGNAVGYLAAIDAASAACGRPLRLMPVLETADIAHVETRATALLSLAELLRQNRDKVLAVRIGGTDLAGLFGMRRGRDLTCYDLAPVRDVISEVVNVFGRAEGYGLPITGCVWEYFTPSDRLLRPQLRATPFARSNAEDIRSRLLGADLDGLVREVLLDIANGLCGKTVIHPSHVPIVHALSAVTHEEWHDARSVATNAGSHRSPYRNKMNEANPHAHWADRVLVRGQAFGVLNENVTFADLLTATM